jgi:hypothetical protein
MPDDALEVVHDYIQWLFPLPTRSMAQPDAPVLDAAEIDAIRADPRSVARLEQAAARMLRFYEATGHWLTPHDHNHLRITRILECLRLLVGPDAAQAFHAAILARNEAAGSPVNGMSLAYWRRAVERSSGA